MRESDSVPKEYAKISDAVAVTSSGLCLRSDGSVVAYKDAVESSIYRDALEWKDIVAISESKNHVVGLKKDGTVVATGENSDGQCDVEAWSDIIAIYAISPYTRYPYTTYTFGIKSDGTVVRTQPTGAVVTWCNVIDGSIDYETDQWNDIVALSFDSTFVMGLKSDGTVVTCGQDLYGETKVSEWTDIVAIKAFRGISVGIKADGSVVSAGDDYLIDTYLKDVKLKVD